MPSNDSSSESKGIAPSFAGAKAIGQGKSVMQETGQSVLNKLIQTIGGITGLPMGQDDKYKRGVELLSSIIPAFKFGKLGSEMNRLKTGEQGAANSILKNYDELGNATPMNQFYKMNPSIEGRTTGSIKPSIDIWNQSPENPVNDLMSQFIKSVEGPAKPFSMGGVDYEPNAFGSHVAVKSKTK